MRRRLVTALSLGALCAAVAFSPARAATPVSPASVDATALINQRVAEGWVAAHLTPAPPASDSEFLRRVWLDLAGRVPTEDEARAFLADTDSLKREHLVDRLLASPDYATHWTDVYLALLVGRDQKLAGGAARATLGPYLKQAFAENRDYARITRELLTSTGPLAQHGEGAFLVKSTFGGGPEGAASASARVFLGLQIGCAQCHDHPSDARYKQADFWALAGYFAQTKVARGAAKGPGAFIVYETRKGDAMMKSHDTGEEVMVPPKFLGRAIVQGKGETRRDALSRAIVSSDLFAKEAVNRVWSELFGRGLVEPFDDLGGEHDANHPPLLNELSDAFVAHFFDLRWLLRSVVLSEAYTRSSSGGAGDPALLTKTFARAAVRPLQPEQLFRSLLTATGFDDVIARRVGEDLADARIQKWLRQYLFVFGDDEMGEVNEFDGSVPQALLLMNGPLTNQGIRARGGSELEQALQRHEDRAGRVESLFYAAYARPPAAHESARIGAYVDQKSGARDAYEDVFHALLTSVESTTNH